MQTIRYFTKKQLVEANKFAIANNLNRSLRPAFLSRLSDDDVYPVSHVLLHNDDHLRVAVVVNELGTVAELDVTIQMYDKLGSVQAPEGLPEVH
jgi:hypothetical protein